MTTKNNGGLRQWHISRPVLDRNGIAVQGRVFQKSPDISGDEINRASRSKEVFLHEDLEKNSCTYDCACSLSCADALMALAAETSMFVLPSEEACDHNNSGQPWGGTYSHYVTLSQSYWCKNEYYTGGYFTCQTCGKTYAIDGYEKCLPHPTVYYKEDGSYYCNVCGYNKD